MIVTLWRTYTVSFRSVRGLSLVILKRVGGGPDNDEHPPRLFAAIDVSRDLATAAALEDARTYEDIVDLVP